MLKEEPIKPEVSKVPEVHVTPLEPPKAVKVHPKVLAEKSGAVEEDLPSVLK